MWFCWAKNIFQAADKTNSSTNLFVRFFRTFKNKLHLVFNGRAIASGERKKKYDQTDCELQTPKEMLTSNVKHNFKEEIVNRMPNHLNTVINHILISFCLFLWLFSLFVQWLLVPWERIECSLSFVRSVYYGT